MPKNQLDVRNVEKTMKNLKTSDCERKVERQD